MTRALMFLRHVSGGDDWRSAVLYVGLVCGAIVCFSAIFLRFRPADLPAVTVRPSINDPASTNEAKSKSEILKAAMRTPYYKNFLLFIVFASWSFNVPILHIAPFAEDQGISEDDAAFLLAMLGAAQIAGRILHGVFADRFGAVKYVVVWWPFLLTRFKIFEESMSVCCRFLDVQASTNKTRCRPFRSSDLTGSVLTYM